MLPIMAFFMALRPRDAAAVYTHTHSRSEFAAPKMLAVGCLGSYCAGAHVQSALLQPQDTACKHILLLRCSSAEQPGARAHLAVHGCILTYASATVHASYAPSTRMSACSFCAMSTINCPASPCTVSMGADNRQADNGNWTSAATANPSTALRPQSLC